MNRALFTVVSAGLLCLVGLYLSFRVHFKDSNTCTMSYSRPVYHPITISSPSAKVTSRYHVYLYREGGTSRHYSDPRSLSGTPVLFIPGNAGSYSQGRSLASLAATMAKEINSDVEFDFFLFHFSEDMSALHGKTLLDEAKYVNDAIFDILQLYAGNSDHFSNPPTSVIIVSHSMGGIVARTLVTLDNYLPNSVNTMITLSTPHAIPPLTFDRDITTIYDHINQYWRTSYTNSSSDHLNPLKDMFLVSISGGPADLMVLPEYTSANSIVPPEHGITAMSYSIPAVYKDVDHLAIVWCHELRQILVETLFAIVDGKSGQRTLPRKARAEVFRRALTSPLDSLTDDALVVWSGRDAADVPRSSISPIGPIHVVEPGQPVPSGTQMRLKRRKINASLPRLAFTGVQVPLDPLTEISLDSVGSSILGVRVKVLSSNHKPRENDIPVVVRYVTAVESRWYENSDATIMWHSSSPFIPFDYHSNRTLRIQVFTPRVLPNESKYVASISIDWTATLANIAMRYRTLVAVYPLAIVLICVLIQSITFYHGEHISFSRCLDIFAARYFGPLCYILVALHLALCLRPFRDAIRMFQIPTERFNMRALQSPPFELYDVHDMLVGTDIPWLFFVPVLLLLASTAVIYVFDRALSFVVTRIRGLRRWFSRNTPEHEASPSQQLHQQAERFTHLVLHPEPVSYVYLAGHIMWLTGLFSIPYQVIFIAATLWHLLTVGDTYSWGYSYLILLLWVSVIDAPIVAVWAHNLNFEWTFAFSTYKNVLAVAPTVILVYIMGRWPGITLPRSTHIVTSWFTCAILGYMIYYCFLYGFMHTFMLHQLVNYFACWLVVLYLEGRDRLPKKTN